ncbi:MAG: FG-GAP-like repeat-containing protein [Bryobacteraceae bacterium]
MLKRREFLATLAAGGLFASRGHAHTPFPVKFRRQPPYASALAFVEPGLDEFPGEKVSIEIETRLREALLSGHLPVAAGCSGMSPAAREYRNIGPGVETALFEKSEVAPGCGKWRESLGSISAARFYSLPGELVRYEVRSRNAGRLEYRVGLWKLSWSNGAITRLEPVEEILTHADKPWFRDVTGGAFAGEPSFHEQLARGIPNWRACLDPACGMDLYGEIGIAAADIDGDGRDEIYVLQPGGLPNRLYKIDETGHFRDIGKEAGLDILDNTPAALFVDLRNSGHQDLVLVRNVEPLLLLNDGKGRFTSVPDAFRFASPPQGMFTSVAAADYDRDGRLDLYFCCYIFFQNEAQYRYPVPYHDARNGPPNFLFRNRLDRDPPYFEDVTAASGMDHNNNRFSFAATWCDYNGDGWPDLYVTNDFGRKNLYRNDRGHFRDVAEEAGVTDLGPGMSAAWLDYDGDGHPDLLVSNMWSSCGQRIVNDPAFGPARKDPALREAYRQHVKGNSLYHNSGDGRFTYTGDAQGIEIGPWSWSCDGFDFDNDGSPELYIACGMVNNGGTTDLMSYFYRQVVAKSPVSDTAAPEYEKGWNAINQLIRQDYSWASPEPNLFFARRAGRYYNFSGVSGLDAAEDSRAFAFTDIDGDGNLDIVLKSRLAPQVRIFQNACGVGRNAVVLALRGTASNRDAIGARVEVDGQVKWVAAGSAFLSQHTKRMHFGLPGQRAEKVRILWPSGKVQDLPPVAAGFLCEVTEGEAQVRLTPLAPRKEWPADVPFRTDNEARLRSAWLWEPVPLPEKRRGPALFVLHAGEPLPSLPVPMESLDLRQAKPDLAAAYAIFRRYLFDYRVDLETPLWFLIDAEGRVRKIYTESPDAATIRAELRSLEGPLPDVRGLPFGGYFIGTPARDYYKLGGALLQAGYGEQALPYFEEMLRRSQDDAKALLAVGRIHLEAKRLPQAREALERAVALAVATAGAMDASLPEAWNELGGVEGEAGNFTEALRCYQKALELAPDLGYALVNAAHTLESLGRAAEAEQRYRHALALDPKNADAANGLGLLMAKQDRNDEARSLFESAIAARRDDASAINNLGVLYINMGRVNDAIAAFEYGIRVAPDSEMLYLNLARLWVQKGERGKAKDLMQALLARKPDSQTASKALEQLRDR